MGTNIEQSLLETIKDDNLKDLVVDYSELALDGFLNDGLLKDIPFFGTFYKGVSAVIGIRDGIFASKVYKFLIQIKDIPINERIKFVEEIEQDEKQKIKVGQTLLMIIDKLDNLDKPRIIGNLFRATIKQQINYTEFLRLTSIVEKAFYPDLLKLNDSRNYDPTTMDHFYSVGLMKLKITEDYSRARASIGGDEKPDLVISYELNELAYSLKKYGFV